MALDRAANPFGDAAGVFQTGARHDHHELLPAHAELLGEHSLQIILVEGKKHQIRVMLGELGYTTVQLKRVRVGPILLGDLKPGADRDLTQAELKAIGF